MPLGNSNTVRVGDAVVALGNADGQDGPPTVVSGKITNLNQSIKASDQGAGSVENLHGMLQTSAPIISGDSGGALANAQGQVIGMNTAANSTPQPRQRRPGHEHGLRHPYQPGAVARPS